MSRSLLLSSALACACAASAAAQVPAGGEFTVNTYTTGDQTVYFKAPVASDAHGNFVVVWQSNSQESGLGDSGVFAQRFDASGQRRGGELHVNQFTTTFQGQPTVVALGQKGRFVVVWASYGPEGFGVAICGRVYGGDGLPLTPEFLVNSYTPPDQTNPAVAADAAGNFVVAWVSHEQDGSLYGIFAQRFGPGGNRLGGEFLVNAYTTGSQGDPSVTFTAGGGFVVTWDSGQDGSSAGVFGRRFSAAGAPIGAEFQVNTFTTAIQASAEVASTTGGGFVVVWHAQDQFGSGYAIAGQRFDGAGARIGAEFQVNSYAPRTQARPSVASDAAGNFTVGWQSDGQDGSARGVFAQRFAASGARRGGEFQVNAYTSYNQVDPGVSADAAGNFVVAWSGRQQDAPAYSYSVQARRFGGIAPAALAVDTSGNRVLEPGESVDVRPSWRNVNGAPQTFASNAVAFTGPPGTTYTITDATADYGTVGNGATAACSDCLGVSTATAGLRPVTHWDATLEERITPDAQGQDKLWSLHLGDSFTDVPSTNQFYQFVETLLHHSVTAGCSATTYCPDVAATREQMAVFVLVAKEGAGYSPPACSAPTFNDVPAGSPFCRWVEELARRGVVSGCGNGNYCPTSPVTREQMAVFVLRTLDPALSPPACTMPVFNDVPASSPFCRWIEELARRGVVTGCGSGNYCPALPVMRDQMGVFISATFGLTLYGP